MTLGLSQGHVSRELMSLVTLVGILTIAGSTYLILYSEWIYKHLKHVLRVLEIRKHPHREKHRGEETYEMVIFGYGRVGFEFVRTAQKLGISYVVVDYNPETVSNLRGDGVSFRFGDAEDVEFLDEIHLEKATIVVSTIPDPNVNLLLVRHYRAKNSEGIIVVVSHNVPETRELYLEGASYVVMPHFLGAEHASKMITKSGLDVATFEKARNTQLAQIAAHESKNIR
jgi:voltage-gated potassium channel Kch